MLQKIFTSPWTALITLTLIASLRVADPVFVESVRLRYFDTLITSKTQEVVGVSVVNIDEAAITQHGQFPFSRDVYGAIIRDLYRRGAGLVVFNVLTPDADRMGRDAAYVQALRQYPTVLPNLGASSTRNTPKVPGSAIIGPYSIDAFVTYPGIIANQTAIESAAAGVGIVNTLPEIDGVVRRMPMVVAHDGKLYPSLAMETLRVAAGDSTFQVKINESGVDKMRIPAFGPVSTDSLSRVWIDWSLVPDVYSLMNLPKSFEGEIVIVGVSAAGLANPVATSLGEMLPQDLQAAVLGTVIANRDRPAIQRPGWADGAEVVALVVLGVVLIFISRWTYAGIIISAVTICLIIPICALAYSNYSWLVDASVPVGGLVLVMLHAYGTRFVSEYLQKQQIKRQFGSYVNPTIVERLQKNPELIKLGGEERELSIVMTDMRNFTGLGESYGDRVEEFTTVLNEYMTAISAPVLKNNGTLIKFIGDASLHVHGAPLDDADHACTAVSTALEMIRAVEGFNRYLASIGKPPVGMGAGVNTGLTLIGNIGSKDKFGYDVLGDSVSTAARLEGQTKGYGVLCIIGPNTYAQVKDEFLCLELDNIAVKGKTVGLKIYVPLGLRSELNVSLADEQMHAAMIELYRQQKFDTAIEFCHDLQGRFGGVIDDYYNIWITRCAEMKLLTLPADWDAVYRATSK